MPDGAASWSAEHLIDHLVSTHHAYERAALTRVEHALATLVRLLGPDQHRLTDAAAAYARFKESFGRHLDKEECVLFPHIRELAAAAGYEPWHSPFGTVVNPIRMMEREHRDALDSLQTICSLVDASMPLKDATAGAGAECAEELRRLDEDLRHHVDLEDHVLFPKAIELEARANHA